MVDGFLRAILWMIALGYYFLYNLWYPGRTKSDYCEFRWVHSLVKEKLGIKEV